MYKYFCKVWFVLLPFFFSATFIPESFLIGFDVVRLGYYGGLINFLNKNISYGYSTATPFFLKPSSPKYEGLQYEFNLSGVYKNFILATDIGFGSISWKGTFRRKFGEDFPTVYKNSGYYLKYGFDYNFLISTPDNNAAFMGIRHCLSFFGDTLSTYLTHKKGDSDGMQFFAETIKTDNRDFLKVEREQKNLFSNWVELVAGVRIGITNFFHVGCNLRYKFFLNISGADFYRPFDILGWGLNNDDWDRSLIGYNFYLFINIPIAKVEEHNRFFYKKKDDKTFFSI